MDKRIWYRAAVFILPGFLFGFVLMQSEVVSWYRIQEMFRFQAFHMYGVIGSAVATAALSLFLIRKLKLRNAQGDLVEVRPAPWQWKRNLFGGIIFGLGWAMGGACPGPIMALAGNMLLPYFILFVGAVAGVFLYGWLRNWIDD